MIAYLAHPVGPQFPAADRAVNLAGARAWFRFLVDATPWAISVPWLAYVENLAEATHRDRGIADDLETLSRCDLVVLTGGRVSPGMATERERAYELGIPIVDLTSCGSMPPPMFREDGPLGRESTTAGRELAASIALRARKAFDQVIARRVGITLTATDLRDLRSAAAFLRSDPVDQDAGAVIDRLIDAATAAMMPQ